MASSEYNYLKGLCKGLNLRNATKALSFILIYHGEQKRKEGSPYYTHPVKVASHLLSLNLFSNDLEKLDVLISGALLHDILEDTDATAKELAEEFNQEISTVVGLLTKTKGVSKEVYYDNIRKNLLASLIKISDRCNNVSTMAGVFSKAKLREYVDETNAMVKPLIRYVRDNNPDISHQVVNMSYHIKSVISAIEVMLPLMSEDSAEDKQHKNHPPAKAILPENEVLKPDFEKAVLCAKNAQQETFYITRYSATGVYGYELLKGQTKICESSNLLLPSVQPAKTICCGRVIELVTEYNPAYEDITIVPGLKLTYDIIDETGKKTAVFEKVYGDSLWSSYTALKPLNDKVAFLFEHSAVHGFIVISSSNEWIAMLEPDESFRQDPCSLVESRFFLKVNRKYTGMMPEIFHAYICGVLGVLRP